MSDSGKLVIKTKIDTKGFEKDIDKLVDITDDAGSDIGDGIGEEITEEITEGVEEASKKTGTLLSSAFSKASGIGKGLLGTVKSLTAMAGKMLGIVSVLAVVVGVVLGAVFLITKAVEKLYKENEQFKVNIQYIMWALEQAVAPILDWIAGIIVKIVQLLVKAIKYAAALIKLLTGYNIFDNASAQKFADHLKDADESAGGISSNLKDVKKQLAGFDEMNVLNDNSGGGLGGVGLANQDFTMPDFDLSDIEDETNTIIDNWEKLGQLVNDFSLQDYIDEYGLYGIAIKGLVRVIYGFWEKIIGQVQIAQGLWDVIVGAVTGDQKKINKGLDKIKKGFFTWLDGFKNEIIGYIEIQIGVLLGSLEMNWNIIKGFFKGIFDWLVEKFIDPVKNEVETKYSPVVEFVENLWKNIKLTLENAYLTIKQTIDTLWTNIQITIDNIKQIVGWLIEQAKILIQPIVDWVKANIIEPMQEKFNKFKKSITDGVNDVKKNVKDIFTNIKEDMEKKVNSIVSLFSKIGTKVGDAIGGALKNAINGVLGGIEWILNKPIDAINGLINSINKIPGLNLTKLQRFSLPRLAQGGIVNNPGPGVMMGSYVAGERGPEAVIPLDDMTLDRLGLAFARHTNINATIPVYVGNRQVAREIRKIEAENNFAFNS